jgi:hypothetical protein
VAGDDAVPLAAQPAAAATIKMASPRDITVFRSYTSSRRDTARDGFAAEYGYPGRSSSTGYRRRRQSTGGQPKMTSTSSG